MQEEIIFSYNRICFDFTISIPIRHAFEYKSSTLSSDYVSVHSLCSWPLSSFSLSRTSSLGRRAISHDGPGLIIVTKQNRKLCWTLNKLRRLSMISGGTFV